MIESKKMKVLSNTVMILLTICAVAPFLLMVSSSLTDDTTLKMYGYSFWPKKISLAAYKYLLSDGVTIVRAYGITILVTFAGTLTSLILTTMLAYSLAVKNLPGRKLISFFVLFAMLFNGGMVPSYIMWTQTFHIRNTIFALIVPNYLVFAFYIILMRSYFEKSIPEEVLESARMDGASEVRTMIEIAIPMAVPIIATVGMMVAITYWNDWTNGLYYVNNDKLFSIQLILNKMITSSETIKSMVGINMELPSTSIKMAVAVVGALPLMAVFPFFQKYYTKGITLGAVKG